MPIFRSKDFELELGDVLSELEIAFELYGDMAPARDNVILVAHGITSTHHAAGPPSADLRRGWWAEAIGPGKLFDTDRFCVFSSNIIGSCYGSTGPASNNPKTGRPYGMGFPEITHKDMVHAQQLALASLGVEQLVAVAGESIGGFQVFQWGVSFPDFMRGLIATDTAPRDTFNTSAGVSRLVKSFSEDANWNNGDYYSTDGLEETLTELRIGVLKSYGFEAKLDKSLSKMERAALLESTAREWAREFDAHSLITLQKAWGRFNVEDELGKIKAKLLFILCDTDEWFPASDGPRIMADLIRAGVDARFHEVHSPYGHYATMEEPEKWLPVAKEFLESL